MVFISNSSGPRNQPSFPWMRSNLRKNLVQLYPLGLFQHLATTDTQRMFCSHQKYLFNSPRPRRQAHVPGSGIGLSLWPSGSGRGRFCPRHLRKQTAKCVPLTYTRGNRSQPAFLRSRRQKGRSRDAGPDPSLNTLSKHGLAQRRGPRRALQLGEPGFLPQQSPRTTSKLRGSVCCVGFISSICLIK